jgi:hypothetical protein
MKKRILTKKEIMGNITLLLKTFKHDQKVMISGEIVTDTYRLYELLQDLIKKHHINISIDTLTKLFKEIKPYEQTETIKTPYKITNKDMDLLVEIENILCKKSSAIWGIRHKRKIKGGGDITPYETGYNKLYDYMELVAKIIG